MLGSFEGKSLKGNILRGNDATAGRPDSNPMVIKSPLSFLGRGRVRRLTAVAAMMLMAGCGSDVSTSSKAVSQLLENPASAKYTNVRVTPEGNVCGQVKGKDASGNFGGFQSYVALKTADGFKAILDKDGNNAEVQAACGPSLPPAPAAAATAGAAAGWEVQIVQGSNMGALSDMTSRLVEHGFMASIAQRDGVTQVYLGPFADKAEADAKRAELMSSQGIESVVVAHQAGPAQ
jgi:hypothetical protein